MRFLCLTQTKVYPKRPGKKPEMKLIKNPLICWRESIEIGISKHETFTSNSIKMMIIIIIIKIIIIILILIII